MTGESTDTLVVPTDFSEHSQAALDYAAGLAEALGARLLLLHAYHVPPPSVPMAGNVAAGAELQTLLRNMRDASEREIAAAAERARKTGVEVETRVVEGPPAEAIATVARDSGADLVVMGTHGRSGLGHLFLGSVAERTIRSAPCPVLTLRVAEAGGA